MAVRAAFPAGLVLDAHKQQALGSPIRAVPGPAVAVVSLDQGSGRSAATVVATGDRVFTSGPFLGVIQKVTRRRCTHR